MTTHWGEEVVRIGGFRNDIFDMVSDPRKSTFEAKANINNNEIVVDTVGDGDPMGSALAIE